MSSRSWLWSAAVLLAAAGPAPAQPPSPLELVRGVRESGSPDLALEYLKDVEEKLRANPNLLPELDRQAIPLERARCLLDAADDEPDEGTRAGMIGEAKEGFNAFILAAPKHPRLSEAALAVARLTSIEAKAQLNRARRIEVPPPPPDGPDRAEQEAERTAAVARRQAEADKARPLFNLASQRFAEAAAQLKAKLDDKTLDPRTRQILTREAFDAELLAAINQYHLAETMFAESTKGTAERDAVLDKAQARFAELAKGPPSSRAAWVARAWSAEILGDRGRPKEMLDEFAAISNHRGPESEDGKKLVRFFQLRRDYLDALKENAPGKLTAVEQQLRGWLARFASRSKPTAEEIAARYYLAYTLQRMGTITLGGQKIDPVSKTYRLPASAQRQFEEAERIYRALGQTDHDYTTRATANRMFIVRRLVGEADKPAADYSTFETAQMAALIQMAKLTDAEKAADQLAAAEKDDAPFWAGLRRKGAAFHARSEAADRRFRAGALLERARELATDKDSPADVTDNLLRLVYFYQTTDQPHQAAVLGEHIARTVRSAGGKSAAAGVLALNGYVVAASRIRVDGGDAAGADAARRADRERALRLAGLLEEKFPNDAATDAARHRLAFLLLEDGRPDAAFEAAAKVRPGYPAIAAVRQLQGSLAIALVNNKDVPPERRAAVYRRSVGDLARVARPDPKAPEDDVRGYLLCRLRLAQLFLSQFRADPETEKNPEARGFARALAAADEVLAAVPSFAALSDKDKQLNLDGRELALLAHDVRARALYLQAKSLADARDLAAAGKVVEAVAAEAATPLYDAKMREWAGGQGDAGDDEAAAQQKAKIAGLAAGVDKVRRDVVMVGFKLRCVQGDAAGAGKMLELLKAAGGGVEANQSALELAARELAAQIPDLRRDGKAKEATDLGAGLSLLLKEFTALKELPAPTILFLGQTFYTVEQYDDAVREFQRIKPPSDAGWATRRIEDYDPMVRAQISREIREYRFAQLYLAKSYRGAKKFDEAEKLLTAAIGTPADEPKKYAYTSLDFRRELAAVYEAKAAALAADAKAAGAEWGKAQKEWNGIEAFARVGLKALKADSPREEVRRVRSAYLDAYFDTLRVVVDSNKQLNKNPATLNDRLEGVARSIAKAENDYRLVELEKKGEGILTPEVWQRYHDLLDKNPQMKAAYKAGGGKLFLDAPRPAN